jgi:nicotinamidase-related amidase
MDYQPGILRRLGDAESALSKAAEAIATARRHGAHVGYVRVAFDDAELKAIPDRNKGFSRLAASGGDFHSDSPATQIHERLAPQPQDIAVRKTRVGAFSTTNLEQQLRERGITTLILAGISTSGVVLSTLRYAADRDYRLFVLSDATADPNPAVHDCLMEKVFPNQADVITVDRLEEIFTP